MLPHKPWIFACQNNRVVRGFQDLNSLKVKVKRLNLGNRPFTFAIVHSHSFPLVLVLTQESLALGSSHDTAPVVALTVMALVDSFAMLASSTTWRPQSPPTVITLFLQIYLARTTGTYPGHVHQRVSNDWSPHFVSAWDKEHSNHTRVVGLLAALLAMMC